MIRCACIIIRLCSKFTQKISYMISCFSCHQVEAFYTCKFNLIIKDRALRCNDKAIYLLNYTSNVSSGAELESNISADTNFYEMDWANTSRRRLSTVSSLFAFKTSPWTTTRISTKLSICCTTSFRHQNTLDRADAHSTVPIAGISLAKYLNFITKSIIENFLFLIMFILNNIWNGWTSWPKRWPVVW